MSRFLRFVADGLAAVVVCLLVIIPLTAWSAGHPLNDTGINWVGGDNTNNLPPAPTGYEGQDADYGRDALARAGTLGKIGSGDAGFDFTKIDAGGNDLAAGAVAWSCVRDNVTGLLWEAKTVDGGLHDAGWTYTWYNSDPATNGGAVGTADGGTSCFTSGRCDTEKFVADVNAEGLCGATDWRLPSARELLSLVDDRTRALGEFAIDPAFFPNEDGALPSWARETVANNVNLTWAVRFQFGTVVTRAKNIGSVVRLVRDGP